MPLVPGDLVSQVQWLKYLWYLNVSICSKKSGIDSGLPLKVGKVGGLMLVGTGVAATGALCVWRSVNRSPSHWACAAKLQASDSH